MSDNSWTPLPCCDQIRTNSAVKKEETLWAPGGMRPSLTVAQNASPQLAQPRTPPIAALHALGVDRHTFTPHGETQ